MFKSMKYCVAILVHVSCLIFNSASADVYMDFTNTLLSTAELLGADESQSSERFIILNGVPITTKIYQVNLNHQVAIEKLSNELLKKHNNNLEQKESIVPPAAMATEDWSAVYNLSLNQLEREVSENEYLNSNYITLAKEIAVNKSLIVDLKFENVSDMKNILFTMHEDVGCNEKLTIKRYPASRRKFCLTELTSEKVISQVVIFEGLGDPVKRITHYQNELANLDYRFDVVDKQASNKSILFAASEFSNTTIFTYKSNNKVLDVIQSQF